jgi:sec-independent protein translocase protein TatC
VFQLPVVVFVLSRLGLVTPGFLIRNFKFAVLAAFIASAIITPSADVVNQTMLAAPIVALYLLGVAVAWLFGTRRTADHVKLVLLAAGLAIDMSRGRLRPAGP